MRIVCLKGFRCHRVLAAAFFATDLCPHLIKVPDLFSEFERVGEALKALASRIIANYMAGLVDEEELLSASRQALGRQVQT
ncbi:MULTISPECIES: hypothetical protein [unclassified Mesorhizobium]|uniref:hypothetical protein n=1 Tax=unclassified Mesorhizobium TaxID=325217 RepID=UPI00333981D0